MQCAPAPFCALYSENLAASLAQPLFQQDEDALHFLLHAFAHIVGGVPAVQPAAVHHRVTVAENVVVRIIK